MAANAIALPTSSQQRLFPCLFHADNPAYTAIGYGILGLLAALPFPCGALFGVTSWACDRVLNWIFTKTDINQNNTLANVVKFALRFFAHAAIGMLVVGAAGFPLSFGAAVLFAASAYLIMPCLLNCISYPVHSLATLVGAEGEGEFQRA